MRIGVFAYRLSVFSAALVAVSALGCAGAARSPRTVPAVELPVSAESTAMPDQDAAAAPAPTPAPAMHHVRPGETLWSIARRYETSVEALVRANGLDDPTRIAAGSRLEIPTSVSRTATVPDEAERRPARHDVTMRWPIPGGRVLSPFGVDRRTHRHSGIDIAGTHGDPVLASGHGRVRYSDSKMRGYGKTVIIDHGDGLSSLYAHNSRLLVKVGDRVDAGQPIARVGRSGNATTDHCHFEIRVQDRPVDPARFVGTTETAAR